MQFVTKRNMREQYEHRSNRLQKNISDKGKYDQIVKS